jgi:hypothetical protein
VADNTAQTGADTIATDDLATLNGAASTGVKIQRVKPAFGVDGDARDVSQAFPLPVNLAASGGSGSQTSGALTAAGASTLAGATSTTGSVVVDVGTAGNISFHLLATAFVGTVVFEQSFDPAGASGTWALVPVLPEDSTSAPMNTLAISTAVAYVRQFTTGMFGPRLFRVRVSVFTSGSLAVLASAGPGWVETQPALAPSTAVVGAVMPAGGTTFTGPTATTLTANTALTVAAADTTGQRKGVVIANRHASGDVLVTFNATATTGNDLYTIPAGGTLEVPQGFVNASISVISTVAAPIRYELVS